MEKLSANIAMLWNNTLGESLEIMKLFTILMGIVLIIGSKTLKSSHIKSIPNITIKNTQQKKFAKYAAKNMSRIRQKEHAQRHALKSAGTRLSLEVLPKTQSFPLAPSSIVQKPKK